mgnify:CR=1 FL=1
MTENNTIENQNEINSIKKDYGDIIIILVVGWMCFSQIFWMALSFFVGINFYSSSLFKITNILMSIIGAIIPFALAFIMKDKTKQVIVFIIAGFYLLYTFGAIAYKFLFLPNVL